MKSQYLYLNNVHHQSSGTTRHKEKQKIGKKIIWQHAYVQVRSIKELALMSVTHDKCLKLGSFGSSVVCTFGSTIPQGTMRYADGCQFWHHRGVLTSPKM